MRKTKKGFSLVECIVAMAVITVVSSSAIVVFQTTTKATGNQWDRFQAGLFANNVLSCFQASETIESFKENFSDITTLGTIVSAETEEEDVTVEGEVEVIQYDPKKLTAAVSFDYIEANPTNNTVSFKKTDGTSILDLNYGTNSTQYGKDVSASVTSKVGTVYTEVPGSIASVSFKESDLTVTMTETSIRYVYNNGYYDVDDFTVSGNEISAFEKYIFGNGWALVSQGKSGTTITFNVYDCSTGSYVKNSSNANLQFKVTYQSGSTTGSIERSLTVTNVTTNQSGSFQNAGYSGFNWKGFLPYFQEFQTSAASISSVNISKENSTYKMSDSTKSNISYALRDGCKVDFYCEYKNGDETANEVVYTFDYTPLDTSALPKSFTKVTPSDSEYKLVFNNGSSKVFEIKYTNSESYQNDINTYLKDTSLYSYTNKYIKTNTSNSNTYYKVYLDNSNNMKSQVSIDGSVQTSDANTLEQYLFNKGYILVFDSNSYTTFTTGKNKNKKTHHLFYFQVYANSADYTYKPLQIDGNYVYLRICADSTSDVNTQSFNVKQVKNGSTTYYKIGWAKTTQSTIANAKSATYSEFKGFNNETTFSDITWSKGLLGVTYTTCNGTTTFAFSKVAYTDNLYYSPQNSPKDLNSAETVYDNSTGKISCKIYNSSGTNLFTYTDTSAGSELLTSILDSAKTSECKLDTIETLGDGKEKITSSNSLGMFDGINFGTNKITFKKGSNDQLAFIYPEGTEAAYNTAKARVTEANGSFYKYYTESLGTYYLKDAYKNMDMLIVKEDNYYKVILKSGEDKYTVFSADVVDNLTANIGGKSLSTIQSGSSNVAVSQSEVPKAYRNTDYYRYTCGNYACYAKVTYCTITEYTSGLSTEVTVWLMSSDELAKITGPVDPGDDITCVKYATYKKG